MELELEKTAKRAKTMAAKFQVGASVKFRNVIYEIKQTLHGDQPISARSPPCRLFCPNTAVLIPYCSFL